MKYNVYYHPDGNAPSFLGVADTLEEAEELCDRGGYALDQSLWETARAAGHVYGIPAPDTSREMEDSAEALDYGDGYYVAVPLEDA